MVVSLIQTTNDHNHTAIYHETWTPIDFQQLPNCFGKSLVGPIARFAPADVGRTCAGTGSHISFLHWWHRWPSGSCWGKVFHDPACPLSGQWSSHISSHWLSLFAVRCVELSCATVQLPVMMLSVLFAIWIWTNHSTRPASESEWHMNC